MLFFDSAEGLPEIGQAFAPEYKGGNSSDYPTISDLFCYHNA